MKLLFCLSCHDAFKLSSKPRQCECGKTCGRYLDDINAIYHGIAAQPMGFSNQSLTLAMRIIRVADGPLGTPFDAFLIPEPCATFRRVDSREKVFTSDE